MIAHDHGYRVCLWRGELPVGCSEAPPATMLLSNSLYLDVVPQMMAGIIMGLIMLDNSDLGRDSGQRRSNWRLLFLVGSSEKENIFPVLLLWFCLGPPHGVVWLILCIPGEGIGLRRL